MEAKRQRPSVNGAHLRNCCGRVGKARRDGALSRRSSKYNPRSRPDLRLRGDAGMTGISNGSNGNKVGTSGTPLSAKLNPLADNGGPTFTHLPQDGSPVLDAGDNTYLRGYWQNVSYFADAERRLQEDFTFRAPIAGAT